MMPTATYRMNSGPHQISDRFTADIQELDNDGQSDKSILTYTGGDGKNYTVTTTDEDKSDKWGVGTHYAITGQDNKKLGEYQVDKDHRLKAIGDVPAIESFQYLKQFDVGYGGKISAIDLRGSTDNPRNAGNTVTVNWTQKASGELPVEGKNGGSGSYVITEKGELQPIGNAPALNDEERNAIWKTVDGNPHPMSSPPPKVDVGSETNSTTFYNNFKLPDGTFVELPTVGCDTVAGDVTFREYGKLDPNTPLAKFGPQVMIDQEYKSTPAPKTSIAYKADTAYEHKADAIHIGDDTVAEFTPPDRQDDGFWSSITNPNFWKKWIA